MSIDHLACIDDGELRYMSGRKAPAYDCELYAMPGGGRAPKLYAAPVPPATEQSSAVAVPDGWRLVPDLYIEDVERAAAIASQYSPCIDMVEESGGESAGDPAWAIHYILYYAGFKIAAAPKQEG